MVNRFQAELNKLEGLLNSLNSRNSKRHHKGGEEEKKHHKGGEEEKKHHKGGEEEKKHHKGGESEDSRYFKVVIVNGKHIEDGGRYELPLKTRSGKPQRRGPKDKASTAFSELCLKEGKKDECKFKFSIQETTRGSHKKIYHYEGRREKLSKPVVLKLKDKKGKVKEVVKRFKNVIKSLGSESSK